MTTKKKPESEFANYEPGEPEDVKAKELAAQAKKHRHDERVESFKSFMYSASWIVGILAVVGAIIFGINRFVHYVNDQGRNKASFVATCLTAGNVYGFFNGDAVCFQGTVVAAIDSDGKKNCIAQGNYPIDVSTNQNSPMYMCMHGRIIAVR